MNYRDDDPPDYPEPPECCGEDMECDGRVVRCATCLRCEEGWSKRLEPGEILTCRGESMTSGDGVPAIKWQDGNGKEMASDCCFREVHGHPLWGGQAPRRGLVVPLDPSPAKAEEPTKVGPFTEEELCELLSAAQLALADADMFDQITDRLDLSDDYMVELREKLNVYLDSW